MLHFSGEYVLAFYQYWEHEGCKTELRLGQAFHQFMKLEKITGYSKYECDRIYQLDNGEAYAWIALRTMGQ